MKADEISENNATYTPVTGVSEGNAIRKGNIVLLYIQVANNIPPTQWVKIGSISPQPVTSMFTTITLHSMVYFALARVTRSSGDVDIYHTYTSTYNTYTFTVMLLV